MHATDAGSAWLPASPSAVEQSLLQAHAHFHCTDTVVRGCAMRIFSWGYELWSTGQCYRPVSFSHLAVCLVADEAARCPPLSLRAVRLTQEAQAQHRIALDAERHLARHPFIDTAVCMEPDRLDPSALIVYHMSAGATQPAFVTTLDAAAVARQMMSVLRGMRCTPYTFPNTQARWRYGRVQGQLLVRLADVSLLEACPSDPTAALAAERKEVGRALMRLIVSNATPETYDEWRLGSDYVASCRRSGAVCLDTLAQHPFVQHSRDGDDDHRCFVQLCELAAQGWAAPACPPEGCGGGGGLEKPVAGTLLQLGVRFHALQVCAALQGGGWAAAHRAVVGYAGCMPHRLLALLLQAVFQQVWRLADASPVAD